MTTDAYALQLEFESFREFVERFASRLSEEGMFVELAESGAAAPPDVGQEVALEARVSSGFGLLKGHGEIAWSRAAGDRPAGFAVRFVQLDEPSRRLLAKVVDSFRREGREVFDLSAAPPPAAVAPEPEAAAGPGEAPADLVSSDLYFEEPVTSAGEPAPDLAKTIATGKTLEDLLAGAPADAPQVRAGVETQLLDSLPEPVPPGGTTPASPPEAGAMAAPDAGATATPDATEGLPESLAEILSGPSEGAAGEIPPAIGDAMSAGWPPAVEGDAVAGGSAAAGGRRGFWRLAAIALLAAAAGLAVYQYRDALLGWLPGGEDGSASAETPSEVAPAPAPGLTDRRGAAAPPPEEPAPEAGARARDTASPAPPPAAVAAGAIPAESDPDSEPPRPQATGVAPRAGPAGQSPSLDGPFTRLESITWSETGGETAIVLTADGPVRPGKFDVLPIGSGDPRVLVKLAGVERPFPGGGVTVGSSHVRRVRTGLHTVPEGREIHIVMDLTDAGVVVDRVEPEGNRLIVVFVRP